LIAWVVGVLLPASLWAGEMVTATGLSFFEPGREVVAREKALDEAKRAAIEKAVGARIQSSTMVENFQVVKDQIFSRTSGYLRRYDIIEEKKTDLGTYEITIEAEVELSALVEDLDRFRKIVGWQKNPRVAIAIEGGVDPGCMAAVQKTRNLLTEKLRENGFKVFRCGKSAELEMGLLVGVNLEMSSRRSSYQGVEIALNEIALSANIRRPGDEEILAASSAVRSLPGENRLTTLDKGARECVDAVWSDLRRKLIRLWEKELYSERDLYLVVREMPSIVAASEIIPVLSEDVAGVLDVRMLSYNDGTAEYSIRYRGWPEQFLNEIQMSYFKEKYFDTALESIAGNKIVVVKKERANPVEN